jgi:hypothetical protein
LPSSALLFVPLVAGFIFLRILHWTRYISRSWESTRLVFSAGVTGLGLVVAARLGVWCVAHTSFAPWLRSLVQTLFPTPYAGTMAGTLLLALSVPPLINKWWITKDDANERTKNSGTRLHAFLCDQIGQYRAVALTLADQKVYVGLVKQVPNLDPCERYIEIAPQLSGYRDEERRLVITTNYAEAEKQLSANSNAYSGWTEDHLKVLVAIDQIVSAHLYNPRLQREAFDSQEEDVGATSLLDRAIDCARKVLDQFRG